MKESKGAYKQRIIKEYIKKPFKKFKKRPTYKNSLGLMECWSFLIQFDFGTENEKLNSIRQDLVKYGLPKNQQCLKSEYKELQLTCNSL